MKNLVGDKGERKGEIMGEMEENCEVSYRSVLSPAEFWVDVTGKTVATELNGCGRQNRVPSPFLWCL